MYFLKKNIKATELAKCINLRFYGDRNQLITSVSPLSKISEASLTFSNNHIKKDSIGVIISSSKIEKSNIILSDSPRLDFIRAINYLEKSIGFIIPKSKPVIHPSVIIGKNVFIDNNVHIGANTIIEPNVVLLNGTKIGKNCLIRANASIGGDGFGFEREPSGNPIKFKHFGGVLIGDDVEIGSSTCVARGTFFDTRIDDFVKIDNLVHIAHNCHIKSGVFIIGSASISGGVIIEKNAWIAPNSSVIQKTKIGKNAFIGIGSVVLRDIDDDSVLAAYPSKVIKK